MPALGVSDEKWVKLLTSTTAICWLFPDHEGLETLRNTMTEIELENPELVLFILDIVENKYNTLDNDSRHNVECLRYRHTPE